MEDGRMLRESGGHVFDLTRGAERDLVHQEVGSV
jgi:hypothetical protein